MTTSTPLSPAAQAVQAAVVAAFWDQHRDLSASPAVVAAAVLRTAANFGEYLHDSQDGKTAVVRVADLEAWATELEGTDV